MKLYHYAPKNNSLLSEGYLSVAISPKVKDLHCYAKRAESDNREDILKWLEQSFRGRSRAISCLTEPIVWQNNDPVLKAIVDKSELFEFETDELLHDGIIESIWCKDGSQASGINEKIYQIQVQEIDDSKLPWYKCDVSKGLIYGVIRHYFLVLKDGTIPARYFKKVEE